MVKKPSMVAKPQAAAPDWKTHAKKSKLGSMSKPNLSGKPQKE